MMSDRSIELCGIQSLSDLAKVTLSWNDNLLQFLEESRTQ